MIRTLATAIALVAALGGCDDLAGPDDSNPYDPAFKGVRIASPPTDLRLVSASDTSVTLAWTDQSSFEGGFRIEASDPITGFSEIAVVPSDVLTYTYETNMTRPTVFRVIALGPPAQGPQPPGQESTPSPTLSLRYSTASADTVRITLPFEGWTNSRPQFSADGTRFYVGTTGGEAGLHAIDVESGRPLWSADGSRRVLGLLSNGSVVADDVTDASQVRVYAPGGQLVQTASVAPLSTDCADLAVSADFQYAAGACGGDATTVVRLDGGVVETVPETQQVVGLSPSGGLVYVVQSDGQLAAVEGETGQVRWVRSDRLQERSLTQSADGRQLLVAEASQIRTVDASTGATEAGRATARPQRTGGFGGAFVAYSDPADRDGRNVDGKTDLVVARASDLGVVRSFFQADPLVVRERVIVTATPYGAVGLTPVSGGYGFVRWNAARPLVAASPAP